MNGDSNGALLTDRKSMECKLSGLRTTIGLLLFVIMLIAVGLAWWLPERERERVGQNERRANASLYALKSAESNYHHHDLDKNGIRDYWTADIAGLLQFGLIDRALAEADTNPLVPGANKPAPMNGYYFVAMDFDDSEVPADEYRQNTDGKSGKVHHPKKYAFCAYPAEPGTSGRYVWIMNQDGSSFRSADFASSPIRRWPSNAELFGGKWARAK